MARKCASAAILDTLRDPRVVTMAPAAQIVWIRMITAMQNSSISVLRFGSEIMNPTGIALFIASAETELVTHLETLIERGLLRRDGQGAILCPMLADAAKRSEINRINGSKGGRPRKDASPPAQRSLILPIDGGGGKTKITESGTETATESAENPTYLLKESVKSEVSVSETDFGEIGKAAFAAAGFDASKSVVTFGIVKDWLAIGADRALILDVIERKTGPHVHSFKYFDRAIREAVAAKPAAKAEWEKEFDRDYEMWKLVGVGVEPQPRYEDYKRRHAA